ncbi:MAG: SpoIID/LytB domain-containing protein [Candidatus Omnitrophica bacterium]|nr:SpoIID/LytB domain-containing protein [Candidatus Omnitrophota bacterium]
MKYRIKFLTILIVILVISYQLSVVSSFAYSPRFIRVAIVQDAVSLSLRVRGSYEVFDSLNQKVLYRGKNLKTTVTASGGAILMGMMHFNANKIFIQPKKDGAIVLDGRSFRGCIQFIQKDNLRLSAINFIDLEDYIKGILYHEVSHYWPLEALKAQAILCRTYALYQIQESKAKDYDVTSDIYSQVYGGKSSERYRTNKAVDKTQYEVLTYQERIFSTYYHATCGGHTQDASLLWRIDIPPLKGVSCNFCADSPHFSWHKVLSLKQIKDALLKLGYSDCGTIKDIIISGRDKSGRITYLKITTNKKDIKIPAKDFRNALGPNVIRSTNFDVKVVDQDVVFVGSGWGHGVGLCQWGAYFMAKQGYSYEQILQYYYPQAQLKTRAD